MTEELHLDDEVLSAFLDGELSDADRQAAVAHQLDCTVCRSRVHALRGVAALVGAIPSVPSIPAYFDVDGSGSEGSQANPPAGGPFDDLVSAALADWPSASAPRASAGVAAPHRLDRRSTERRPHRRVIRMATVAAALVAAIAFAFAAAGRPPPHDVPSRNLAGASLTGVRPSLGSFSDATSLRTTLAAEITSLAPGRSGQVLPCHDQAAVAARKTAGAVVVFAARLTYAGKPAQVFAYRTSASAGDVAVVEADGYCTLIARLSW